MAFKVLKPFPTPSKFFVVDQEIGVEDMADAPREPAFYVEQGYLLDLDAPPAKKVKPSAEAASGAAAEPAPAAEPATEQPADQA